MITGASAGVGRDFGAHGRFSRQARGRSWQVWLTEQRRGLAAAAVAAVGVLAAGAARR